MTAEHGLAAPRDWGGGLGSAFEITFVEDTCGDCGHLRALDVACEECGSAPTQDEGPLLARRAAVDPVLDELCSGLPVAATSALEASEWRYLLGDWLEEFLEGLNTFVRTGAIDRVHASCVALRRYRADVTMCPRYRPDLGEWAAIEAGLAGFDLLAVGCMEALRAPTAPEAERLANAAQADLTAAQDAVARWADRRDAWLGAEEDPPSGDLVWDGTSRAMLLLGGEHDGFIEIEQSGQPQFERVTGETPSPAGIGLALRMAEVTAEAVFDVDRFWRCAELAYRRLTSTERRGRAAIGSVAATPGWADDMRAVQMQLAEAIRDLPDLTTANETRMGRATVRLGHLVAERAAKYLIATLLAAYRDRDYTELRKMDLGALLTEAGQVGLASLLLGVDKAMRHGDAHGEFTIEDDGIRFTADRREYDFLTWPELVDRVMAGIESTNAIFVAVLCAVGGTAVADDIVDLKDIFGPEQQIFLVTAADGWTAVEVGGELPELTVTGVRGRRPKFSTVGAMAAVVPGEVVSLTVDASSPEGRDVYAGPVEPMRKFQAHTGPEKEAWLVDIFRAWTLNDRVIADSAFVRKVVSANVLKAARSEDEPIARRTAVIGPWLETAKRAEDEELIAAVNEVAWAVRMQGAGLGPDGAYDRALRRLTSWDRDPVSWPLSA